MLLPGQHLRLHAHRELHVPLPVLLDHARASRLPAAQQARRALLRAAEVPELGPEARDEARAARQARVLEHLRAAADVPRERVEVLERAADLLAEDGLDRLAQARAHHGPEERDEDRVVRLLDRERGVLGHFRVDALDVDERAAPGALAQALGGVRDRAHDDVDVHALRRDGELEEAVELRGPESGGLVVVVERHLLQLQLETLEVNPGERADRDVRLARGRGLDVNVGDVADVCVTWEQGELGDVEVLQHEFDFIVLVLGSKQG